MIARHCFGKDVVYVSFVPKAGNHADRGGSSLIRRGWNNIYLCRAWRGDPTQVSVRAERIENPESNRVRWVLALGVLFECQRRQISVPGNMAIVGFNDLEFMAAAVPSLTSVRTNRYEMGRHAITMVIDAIEGRRPPEPVIDLGFQLMIRESSMPQTA